MNVWTRDSIGWKSTDGNRFFRITDGGAVLINGQPATVTAKLSVLEAFQNWYYKSGQAAADNFYREIERELENLSPAIAERLRV